jgi:hypothetical protein
MTSLSIWLYCSMKFLEVLGIHDLQVSLLRKAKPFWEPQEENNFQRTIYWYKFDFVSIYQMVVFSNGCNNIWCIVCYNCRNFFLPFSDDFLKKIINSVSFKKLLPYYSRTYYELTSDVFRWVRQLKENHIGSSLINIPIFVNPMKSYSHITVFGFWWLNVKCDGSIVALTSYTLQKLQKIKQ